jgi:hypothetical protein
VAHASSWPFRLGAFPLSDYWSGSCSVGGFCGRGLAEMLQIQIL